MLELIHRIAFVNEPEALTREQVQNVYDELERLSRDRAAGDAVVSV